MEAAVTELDRTVDARRDLDGAITRALDHLQATQAESGAWLGDYGGPMFLLPMYIGSCVACDIAIPPDVLADMVRYLRNTQNEDGGWGLHVEGHSLVFTSSIIYAALRLSGVAADDGCAVRARRFIHENGSPLASASWGKFFLTLLNLHDYRGLNPVPPELWILPESLPMHPSRLWCHARMVSLPMAYLYGQRVQRPLDALALEIRRELYTEPYDTIDWASTRDRIAKSDEYTPFSALLKAVNRALLAYEARPIPALRKRALKAVLGQVDAEDRNTNYVCLGPVNKVLHLWVWKHANPRGPELVRHVERLPEYLWRGEDGTKMQGYHSSQLWDTAFAVQAMLASGELERCSDTLVRAHQFIDDNQVREDLPNRERSYRDPTKGGFCFSAKDNGWIVSDCTAEGLRAALALRALVPTPFSQDRLRDAVDYLLWSQTEGGGWASYEPARGPRWLELLNVASVFGDIMIDYPYVECTSAAIQALLQYRAAYPGDREQEIERAVERGKRYLLEEQRADGSFEGSWAICFTYGTWFGIEGLRALGLPTSHQAIARACSFLESHQLPDGGWGELPESSSRRVYVHTERGQAVMTAWALLALVAGGRAGSRAVSEGVRFLIGAQRPDGSYPPEHIAGMFNKTCAIHYDNYLKVFPLLALAEVRRHALRS